MFRFSKYDFFQVIFYFRFFRTLQRFNIYYIFFFSLCSSVPFLIHYKPLAIPKHKSYYNVYNIYININYIPPGNYCKCSRIYSPSDFAAVPMVNQSRRNVPYIYITLCTIQLLFYTLSIMQF